MVQINDQGRRGSEDRAGRILQILHNFESDYYSLFAERGLAAECLRHWYPAVTIEEIADTMTRGFAEGLLQRMNIPSEAFKELAKTAFQVALTKAMEDVLASKSSVAEIAEEAENDE
jgi:hypothetical protein